VPPRKTMDDRKLLEELFNAIELWEDSPYYLPSEELFDLERFCWSTMPTA